MKNEKIHHSIPLPCSCDNGNFSKKNQRGKSDPHSTLRTHTIRTKTKINMKKIMLSISIIVLWANLLFAQESYFKFSMGYGLPSGSQLLAEKSSFTTSSTGSMYSTAKGVYGSYGSGLALNASFGRMFSSHFGLDLNLLYLPGKKYDGSDSYTYPNYDGTTGRISSSTSSYARALLFSPTLVVAGGEGNVRPYAKIGFAVGTAKILSESGSRYTSVGSTPFTSETKTELTGGVSFGFKGGAGLDFGISKRVSFFTELMFTSMSYYPKKGEVTENKINGVSQPATPIVTFKEQTTYTNNNPNPGTEQLRYSVPLGSLCMNVGLKIKLSSAGQKGNDPAITLPK